ncbi:uncharacterized protein LOC142233598 [Haematobia irritans]|uniref:uncharacterized protein LOC142233598 n=1 Tax=Haematobia irritans TaxID=7368 RepID=UPI003F4FBB0C
MAMFLRAIVFVFIFNIFIEPLDSAIYIKVKSVLCKHNAKYFWNHTCRLKPVNRYKSEVYMTTYIKDSLTNVTANMVFFKRNDVGIYRPFLVNYTGNVCKFFERKLFNPYMKIAMEPLLKYSNVNHSCPYTGKIFVAGLYIDAAMIPVPIPPSYYKAEFKFYEGHPRQLIGEVSFSYDISEKYQKRNV